MHNSEIYYKTINLCLDAWAPLQEIAFGVTALTGEGVEVQVCPSLLERRE